ncbi:MAG: PspC domain-containing protein [Bacteroidales bacterium]|jgi:phage shock protein PspC (stress-responsive transcriptional regulator)|nr:PspC domain-containing protein [Bacteroidales bacterium]MDY0197839.1 PspC domain-containing protein [Tenuifilaceae bacterium]
MKKSIKISLGGLAFNIEEDAYAILEEYIESLRKHLGNTPEAKEIVGDLEERASELFTDLLKGTQIITIDMVKSVIETLGRPEQIADEGDDNGESANSSDEPKNTTRRRLYRDGENAIIAGVASGLGNYFNIDPLVFRILFAALLFANGLGLIIYIILWIAVPTAETTRQRMEMRGENINFSNLEKNVREELNQVKQNMEKKNVSGFFQKLFNALGQVFFAIFRVLWVIAKVFVVIFAVLFISLGVIGLLFTTLSIFFGSLIVSLFPSLAGLTLAELIGTTFDLGSTLWVVIPVFFVLIIPLLALIFLGLRMVFRFKIRDTVVFVAAATTWIVAVTILAFVLFFQARSFSIRETVKDKTELVLLGSQTSTIRLIANTNLIEGTDNSQRLFSFDEYTVAYTGGRATLVGKPSFFIGKSTSENFELLVLKRSRGVTSQLARMSANGISLLFELKDNVLMVDPFFTLKQGEKWRAQDVEVTLLVPEGKQVYVDRSMEPFLSTDQEYCMCWPDELVGRIWKMRGNRLVEIE